jgi:hypothetical protein
MAAAASTSARGTRCVPVTWIERTTRNREPSRAQPAPAMIPVMASAKKTARHGV